MYRCRQCSYSSGSGSAAKGIPLVTNLQPDTGIGTSLAQTLGCAWTTCLEQVDEHADLYIVSVKDSVLETVISQLAHCNPDALYLHTAGSMPMEVWKGKFKNYGVAYPMQTFSKQREVNFEEVPFFLEANSPENLSLLQEIARSLSRKCTKPVQNNVNTCT